jgi:FkbM family methyltransferase
MINIEKKKLKHGIFSYYTNDRYIGKSLSEYGEWSEGEVDLLKQILPNNGNVIEIGSNIGTHTVPLAKHVSNGGIVWAIEPQSQNYTLLSKNIKDNNLNNVKTLKLAISSKKGKAYMDTFDENSINNYGDSKIHKNNFKNSESVTVKTLDQLFEDCFKETNIQLIKCDAQGQELNIILGSNKIINIYINLSST